MKTISITLLILLAFLFLQSFSHADPLGRPGTVARYELDGEPSERTAFEIENRLTVVEASMQLGPVVEERGETPRQWYGLQFSRLNGDSYQMWILLDSWPTADRDPGVYQYLWREPGWPDALNFVHEVTGVVQLPRLCLWTYGWPQEPEVGTGSRRAPVTGMPEQMLLQGWLFDRVATDHGQDVGPPSQYTDLPLNPELLNGWLAFDRDDVGRPWYWLGQRGDGPEGRYEYVAKTPEDLKAYPAAGANFLVTHPGKRARANFPDWLTRSSMYHNNLAYQPLDWLHLERENQFGVTYREVLTNAALEVERLLRAGVDFDIAVDDPVFQKTGYDHLILAQADGTVRIEREGEAEAQYPSARPVDRPDLGPAPQLTLEVVESEDGKAGKLRIRAIAEIGTGEWAGERPEPLISWEIYGPDNKVSPSIFPEYGAERTLQLDDSVEYTLQHPVPEHLRERGRKEAPVEGSYTIRAATADVFGRPAVAYKTIYVQSE